MTIQTPVWLQAGTYAAQRDRALIAALLNEGVVGLNAGDLKVTQRAAGANFTVDVAAGRAIVTGDDQADQGNYLVTVDAAVTGTVVGAAPGSNSRIDLVTLKVNDPNAGGPAGSNATLVVVAGTAAASPVAPALPASSLLLAQILIDTSTVSITDSLITDYRVQASKPELLGPVGEIKMYAGAAAPTGWLLCQGQSLLRASYPALFAVIGTTFGTVDGTHFTLPDMQGRFPIGVKAADADFNSLGETGGSKTHSISTAELPAHDHGAIGDHQHPFPSPGFLSQPVFGDGPNSGSSTAGIEFGIPGNVREGPAGGHTHASVGSNTPMSIVPPYLAIHYIVKYA